MRFITRNETGVGDAVKNRKGEDVMSRVSLDDPDSRDISAR